MSPQFAQVDFANAKAEPALLSYLTSFLVPNHARDLEGIYEVFHCLVEDIEPASASEAIYYLGCPTCKKKSCTQHDLSPVALFLANVHVAAAETKGQAKAIGDVLGKLLKISADECQPLEDGSTHKLDDALETLRATPFNLRFVIGKSQDGSKNVLELVAATNALDVSTAVAPTFPASPLRIVQTEFRGIPPCAVNALKQEFGQTLLYGKPANTIQALLYIADTGEQNGSMQQDGDFVRLQRNAVCCLSGAPVLLHVTGALRSLSKYVRWTQRDVMFGVLRILSCNDGTWNLLLKGSQKFITSQEASVFNAYFTEYEQLTKAAFEKTPFAIDRQWTPKRRKQEILGMADSASQTSFSPKTFVATPVKFAGRSSTS